MASSNGHLPVVQFLSTLPGVDSTAHKNNAFIKASKYGHLPVVEFLTTLPNVNPTAQNNRAFIEIFEIC